MNTFILNEETENTLSRILLEKNCSTVKIAEKIVREIYREKSSSLRFKMIEYILTHYSIENIHDNLVLNKDHYFSESVFEEIDSDWGTCFRAIFSLALKWGIPLNEMVNTLLFESDEDEINYNKHVAIIAHIISSDRCFREFNAKAFLEEERADMWLATKWKYRSLLDICCDKRRESLN